MIENVMMFFFFLIFFPFSTTSLPLSLSHFVFCLFLICLLVFSHIFVITCQYHHHHVNPKHIPYVASF